jgi:hypothetical protein
MARAAPRPAMMDRTFHAQRMDVYPRACSSTSAVATDHHRDDPLSYYADAVQLALAPAGRVDGPPGRNELGANVLDGM